MFRLAPWAALLPLLAACGATSVDQTTPAEDYVGGDICDSEWRSINTSIEGHFVQNGFYVTTMAELIPESLAEEIDGWYLGLDEDGFPEVLPDAAGRCGAFASVVDEYHSALFNPVGESGRPCYEQLSMLASFSRAVLASTGEQPTSQEPWVDSGVLPEMLDLYALQADGRIQQIFNGTCVLSTSSTPEPFTPITGHCYVDWLDVSAASFFHQRLASSTATNQELLDAEYIDRLVTTYEVDPSGIVVVSSPDCPAVDDVEAM